MLKSYNKVRKKQYTTKILLNYLIGIHKFMRLVWLGNLVVAHAGDGGGPKEYEGHGSANEE